MILDQLQYSTMVFKQFLDKLSLSQFIPMITYAVYKLIYVGKEILTKINFIHI